MENKHFLERAWSKVAGKAPEAKDKSVSEIQKEKLLGKHATDVTGEVPPEDIAKKYEEAKGQDAWREQQ